MNSKLQNDAITHLMDNVNLIYESIKLADQKAGILVAANAALLTLVHPLLTACTPPIRLTLGFVGAAGLVLGAALGFVVVIPRGHGHGVTRGRGVVDTIRIAEHPDANSFVKQLESMSTAEIIGELQLMQYDYSAINRRKYDWLRYAILVSAIAWLLALSFITVAKF